MRRRAGLPAVLVAIAALAGCGDEPGRQPNGLIALSINDRGFSGIYTMRTDGSGRRRLTPAPPKGTDASGHAGPDWAPDGSAIAFSSTGAARDEDDRDLEIYTMRRDGSGARRLTRNRVPDSGPAWSPDGRSIAFARWAPRDVIQASLYVMDRAGGRVRRLTTSPTFDSEPSWSPDGHRIAFSRVAETGEGATAGIFVIDAVDGSGIERVIDDAREPAWSPDGRRIAFSTPRDRLGETCFHECQPSGEIYVADADGSHQRRLTRTESDENSPAWSRDGRQLLFVSDRPNPDGHQYELFAMRADGSCPTRLTTNSPDLWEGRPDWDPTSGGAAALRC